MKLFVFIRELSQRYSGLLVSNTILIILLGIFEAGTLFTVGPLIDFLINSGTPKITPLTKKILDIMHFWGMSASLKDYLIIFIIFISLSILFRIFAKYSLLKTKYAVTKDIMSGTFRDFFRARWHFFSSAKQGTLLNTFMREMTVVGDAFGALGTFFAGLLQLVFCLAVPFYISWQVTAFSLAVACLLAWPFILLSKMSYNMGKLNTLTANQIGVVIQESFSLAKVILGFGNAHKSSKYLDRAFDAHCRATIKSQTLSNAIPAVYQSLGVIVLIVALFAAKKFGVAVSETAVLLLALLRSVFLIGSLASGKNSLENFFPSYEQIKTLRFQAKQLEQPSGSIVFSCLNNAIEVKNVSFSYPTNDNVLNNISIRIPKGHMIAVVGESGAGKSTLIDIIMGFYQPQEGIVTCDGIDLRELDINSYRQRIGYVPQDNILFNMSIRDNLLWACDDASDEDIKQACRQANADEFIELFPQSYDTLVGDRGVRLSGGQRQRIALSRAILRKPNLLILDEATSSLDTHSERLIQGAIENIAKDTTVIVIAHRLSTIVNADYVYAFEKGRVVEEGTYYELIKKDGHFNRMVKLQLLEAVN